MQSSDKIYPVSIQSNSIKTCDIHGIHIHGPETKVSKGAGTTLERRHAGGSKIFPRKFASEPRKNYTSHREGHTQRPGTGKSREKNFKSGRYRRVSERLLEERSGLSRRRLQVEKEEVEKKCTKCVPLPVTTRRYAPLSREREREKNTSE